MAAYIFYDKKTKELKNFEGIKELCRETGIKPDNLYTHFGRKGLMEFDHEDYKIVNVLSFFDGNREVLDKLKNKIK